MGSPASSPQAADLHQVDEPPDLLLDGFQAAQLVQLGQKLLQGGLGFFRRGFLRQGRRLRLGFGRGRCRGVGRGGRGDKLPDGGGRRVPGQFLGLPLGEEAVQIGLNGLGLLRADAVIGPGEQEEEGRQGL